MQEARLKWAPSSSAVYSDTSAAAPMSSSTHPSIAGLRLGLYTAEDIERAAAAVLTDHAVYNRNLPKLGGPNDPAMGSSDRRVLCNTCRCSYFRCPGHMGVLRLPIPLYHVGFMDITFKLLQSVCWVCSKLLGAPPPPSQLPPAPMARFNAAFEAGKGRYTCPHCKCRQPKYRRVKGMAIEREWTPHKLQELADVSPGLAAVAQRPFTAADALDIFKNMDDDTIMAVNMDPQVARPEALILQNLAVLPPNARPAIMAVEGSKRRGQNDTTSQLQDIFKAAYNVRRAMCGTKPDPSACPEFDYAPPPPKATTAAGQAAGNVSVSVSVAPGPASDSAHAPQMGASTSAAPGTATAAASAAASAAATMTASASAAAAAATAATSAAASAAAVKYVTWTSADVTLLRGLLPGLAASITPDQAAAVWAAHPILCTKLQDEVTVMINNKGRHAPLARQRTGVPKCSLMARLEQKQGRIRGNIFARRTDQNARTVIKPDRYLDVDQLGVPHVFMTILTKPEEVRPGNLKRLQDAVARGPGVAGGAARILRADGQLVQLHLLKPGMPKPLVGPGDVVERHLVDGDMGVLNRQPTLHRLSLMAHKIVGIPGKAMAVALGTMAPYNADCDGDEMNLHALQSIPGDAEARYLLAVSANVINPQTNAPCLSLVQDTRTGAALLSARGTLLGEAVMHACMGAIRYKVRGKEFLPPPALTGPDGEQWWTGKQLISLLLPPGLFLERRVRGAGPDVGPDDPQERYVRVVDGELLAGTLCKATLGTGTGGLVHKIHNLAGPQGAVRFISDFQRVVSTWLPTRGLTMGLQDCVAPVSAKRSCQAAVAHADAVVEALTRRGAELGHALTRLEAATLEAHILTVLTSVLDYASRCVLAEAAPAPAPESRDDDGQEGRPEVDPDTLARVVTRERDALQVVLCTATGFRDMVSSGAKGNANNVAQVKACLAQQVIEGERVAPSAVSGRTLPCFPTGAFSAAARGFIAHSYLDGMTPAEFYFHMMAGREGLVATAVKTADTGYKYRSMAAAMQSNVVAWDYSVRNGQGYMLELVAGGDALNPCAVERVDVGDALRGGSSAWAARCVRPGRAEAMQALQAFVRSGLFTPTYPEGVTRALLPMDPAEELAAMEWAIAKGRVRPLLGPPHEADAPAQERLLQLEAAVDDLLSAVARQLPLPETSATLRLALAWTLTAEGLTRAGMPTATAFTTTLGSKILQRVRAALVSPGDSVGVLSAHSIGEPSTQFTLNVFHYAGLSQQHLTVGVPRLNELLHVRRRIRTPTMTAPLRRPLPPADAARRARSLQFLCLDSVTHSSYVVLDPVWVPPAQPPTLIVKDAELLQHVVDVFGPEPEDASPWVIRFTLNRAMLAEHGLTPGTVATAIAVQLPRDVSVSVVYAEPNMRRWVVRVRTRGDVSERAARVLHGNLRESVLLEGIDGVRAAQPTQLRVTEVVTPEDVAAGRAPPAELNALRTVTKQAIVIEGAALQALATRDWIAWEEVVTNDVVEVAEVLGLAAARAVLFTELDRIVSYDGGYVDARHLAQIVATITHRGGLSPMTRHGINRGDLSVLHRASFEQPVDMLLQGAVQGTVDPLRGICESIYAGVKGPIGTGTVAVQEDTPAPQPAHAPRDLVGSRELWGLPGSTKTFRERRTQAPRGRPQPPPPQRRHPRVPETNRFDHRPPMPVVATALRAASASELMERLRAVQGGEGGSSRVSTSVSGLGNAPLQELHATHSVRAPLGSNPNPTLAAEPGSALAQAQALEQVQAQTQAQPQNQTHPLVLSQTLAPPAPAPQDDPTLQKPVLFRSPSAFLLDATRSLF